MLMAAGQFPVSGFAGQAAVSMPACLGGHAGERGKCWHGLPCLSLITDERIFVMCDASHSASVFKYLKDLFALQDTLGLVTKSPAWLSATPPLLN